jgi:hypothetical protein
MQRSLDAFMSTSEGYPMGGRRAIGCLPRRDQQALFRTIDAFLKSAGGD